MRRLRLASLLPALLGLTLSARAQRLFTMPVASPLSAYEFHEGTLTKTGGRPQPATLRLALRTEPKSAAATIATTYGTGRNLSDDRTFATLVVKTPTAVVRPDSVAEFTFEGRRFVHLSRLTPDLSLRDELNTEFVEVIADTGRIALYGYYPSRGNRFALSPGTPGMIHESDLIQSFVWQRRGEAGVAVAAHVPPRGFNEEFERQMRTLFADRPDILKYIDSHQLRREDIPAAVRAVNSGAPFRFE